MSGRLGIKLCVWSQVLCEFPVSGYSLAVIVPAFSQPAGVPQEKAFLKDFNRVFPPLRLSVREGKNLFSQLSAVLVYIPLYFLLFSLNLLLSFYMNIAAHFCLPH